MTFQRPFICASVAIVAFGPACAEVKPDKASEIARLETEDARERIKDAFNGAARDADGFCEIAISLTDGDAREDIALACSDIRAEDGPVRIRIVRGGETVAAAPGGSACSSIGRTDKVC